MRRGFLDVLRQQADVIGRRALVAIAVDRRAVEQRADRRNVFFQARVGRREFEDAADAACNLVELIRAGHLLGALRHA